MNAKKVVKGVKELAKRHDLLERLCRHLIKESGSDEAEAHDIVMDTTLLENEVKRLGA